MKIVMLDRMNTDFTLEKSVFAEHGADFSVTYFNSSQELISLAQDADVLMFNDANITAEIISGLKKCKMIIRYGIGYDNVDLEEAGKRGIYVCNAPSYGTLDVAEHAMALLLSACKHIPLADKCARSGKWSAEHTGKVRRLSKKTLGLIGFGRIGSKLAEMAKAFGMKILVFDPYADRQHVSSVNATLTSLDELLQQSDYISLHAPLTRETYHMIGTKQLAKMKNEAIIINTSRGALINESELTAAISDGVIAGAALDVFEQEPLSEGSELLTMENVVLTPHVAWNSFEGVTDLHREVTDNVIRFIRGEEPTNVVNRQFLIQN